MSAAGGDTTIINIGADPAGVIDALDSIMAGLQDVTAAMDEMSGGASLADVDASLSEISSMASEAASAMSGLADSEGAASDGASGLEGAMGALSDGILGVIERASELAGAFLEFQAIMGVIDAVKNFVGNMIGMNEQFQRLDVTLKDMVGSNRAQQLIEWVQQFGQHIPFTTEQLMNATVAITAFGQNAEQVMPAVAAAAAAMSARGVTLETATRAFIDAMNGRFIMLQNTLGISKEELVKFGLELDKKGHVINNSFIPAFEKLVKAKYPTILADQMGTFGGMLAEANDILQLFAMHLGAPLFAMAQEGLGMVMQFVSDHSADLDHLAEIAGGFLANGFRFFGAVIQGVGTFIKLVLVPAFQGLMNLLGPLVGPIGAVAGAFARIAAATAGGLVAGLAGIADGFRNITGQGGPLQGIVQGVAGALQNTATWVNNVVDGVTKGTGPFASLKVTLQPIGDIFKGLGNAIQSFLQWFEPVAPQFIQFGDAILLIPGKASGFMQMLQSIGDFFKPLLPLGQFIVGIFINLGEGIKWAIDRLQPFMAIFGPMLASILSQLGGAWAELSTQITENLLPALGNLGQALLPLLPVFRAIGAFITTSLIGWIGVLINFVASIVELVVRVIAGVIQAVSGGIQAIVGFFQLFNDLLEGHWSKLGSDLQTLVGGIWNAIVGVWQMGIGAVFAVTMHLIDNLIHLFVNLADQLVGHSIIPDMIHAIVDWFGKLAGWIGQALAGLVPGMLGFAVKMMGAFIAGLQAEVPELKVTMALLYNTVATPLIALGSNAFSWGATVISQFIGGLVGGALSRIGSTLNTWIQIFVQKMGELGGRALTWGEDIINNLVNGIRNNLGRLANIVNQVASMISQYLHFSVPEKGPLSDADQWGGHLVDNIMHGVEGKLPALQALMRRVAGTLVPAPGGIPLGASGAGLGGAGGAGGLSPVALQQIVAAIQQGFRAAPLGAAPVNAQTGSVIQQQFGNLNFNGVQNLQTLYTELNFLGGLAAEFARRGAVNP